MESLQIYAYPEHVKLPVLQDIDKANSKVAEEILCMSNDWNNSRGTTENLVEKQIMRHKYMFFSFFYFRQDFHRT